MKKMILGVALVLGLGLSYSSVVYASAPESVLSQGGLKKGDASPSFSYKDINGKTVTLESLKGKIVYIDVWATWCPPCRAELPALKELEEKYGEKMHFVSISCDQDKTKWETMVKEKELKGIQLHIGTDRSFMQAYAISGIPRFILLDEAGKIISSDMTRPSNPETGKVLESLLK
ncbi:TlpA disulfide reductase family protein [Bacteroides eggerthii]|uniref:TlpA disulfide reductase family protein n=1 Tax=Bacteroides eggerthii TaxID=28111 RepID=A0ABT7U9J8_9BACE|nr:TlpA disulfide reductase family protein [Bacteroides eggerthii]